MAKSSSQQPFAGDAIYTVHVTGVLTADGAAKAIDITWLLFTALSIESNVELPCASANRPLPPFFVRDLLCSNAISCDAGKAGRRCEVRAGRKKYSTNGLDGGQAVLHNLFSLLQTQRRSKDRAGWFLQRTIFKNLQPISVGA